MAQKHSFKQMVVALKQPPFFYSLLMGFASGMPLFLTSRTMQFWLKEAGVDLTVIGIFAIVGLPYTLKFLWAPFLDRFTLPFLGHRKGWLAFSQLALTVLICGLGLINPAHHLWGFAVMALLVAFFSATQDIVVDAYRLETLKDEELGLGTALYTYGYKIALLITGALALLLADHMAWKYVYLIMAAIMGLNLIFTIKAPEPKTGNIKPKTMAEALVLPFKEFFNRKSAIVILLFIVLYKVGDNMAGNMLAPFYLDRGYTKTEIAIIAKTIAPTLSWVGPILGGSIVYFFGIWGSLWIAGFLQAASTFGFTFVALAEKNLWLYGAVVSFEDITAAVGSIAFVSFMSNTASRKFTATQYALLSSLAGVPRVIIGTPTGYLAKQMGWSSYFLFCTLAAIPGMLLLLYLRRLNLGEKIDEKV
ncbi:MAG: AmpG family muropeptide MFS transporter [Pseudomonadota bacterium]|nr:AmpG family muropeptide MFS transporter [Pseudomonadota bacterium]